jgi:hypothetical protein
VRLCVAVVCAAALGFTGACTSAPADTTGDDTTDAGATTEPSSDPTGNALELSCSLAPAALVKSTLNIDVSPPAEVANGAATECTYLSGIGGTTVTVRLQTGDGADAFAIGRRGFDDGGQPTSDVTGLGDEAYKSSVEFGDVVTNTLVARKGTVEVYVEAAAPVDAEKALIQRIFESAKA